MNYSEVFNNKNMLIYNVDQMVLTNDLNELDSLLFDAVSYLHLIYFANKDRLIVKRNEVKRI